MKKIFAALLAFFMLFTLVSCSSNEDAPDGMKNAAKEENPFYMYVPQSWVTNSGEIVGAYYSTSDKSNISIMPYGGDLTSSEEYWNDFKSRCEAEFAEFEVVKENEAKVVSGRNALQYVYKMKVDGTKYQCQQTVLAYGNLLYVITYTSTEANYESHIADVDNILAEFKFK